MPRVVADGATAAAKLQRNLGGARETMEAGIRRVREAPGKAAAAKSSEWQRKVSTPEARQAYEQGCAAQSLEDWQQSMLNEGVTRATGSGEKAARNWNKWWEGGARQITQEVVNSLPARGSDSANEQRQLAMARGMKRTKKRRR